MSRAFLRRNDTAEFENDNARFMKPPQVGNTYGDVMENLPGYRLDKRVDGIISNCKVVERENFIKCEMPILKHLNIGQGLHGAVSMLIVDSIEGSATQLDQVRTMYLLLSTSFFSGAGIGDVLEMIVLGKNGQKACLY